MSNCSKPSKGDITKGVKLILNETCGGVIGRLYSFSRNDAQQQIFSKTALFNKILEFIKKNHNAVEYYDIVCQATKTWLKSHNDIIVRSSKCFIFHIEKHIL
jgi:hypothetical protein